MDFGKVFVPTEVLESKLPPAQGWWHHRRKAHPWQVIYHSQAKASHIFQRKYLKYQLQSHFPVNTSTAASKFVAVPL